MEDKKNLIQQQEENVRIALKKIKNKIIVCSGKGGVGKSTICANLAIAMAMNKQKVGILDIDITGPTIPKLLNIQDNKLQTNSDGTRFMPVPGPLGIKVMSMAFLLDEPDAAVIWRGPMKMTAIRQFLGEGEWGDLDYLFIDLPPGTGDEPLEIMQLISDAAVIIVTTPQDVALNVSRKAITMANKLKRKILGIIENMSGMVVKCPDCNKEIKIDMFGEGGAQQAAFDFNIDLLANIPFSLQMRLLADQGQNISLKEPNDKINDIFQAIIKKIQTAMR